MQAIIIGSGFVWMVIVHHPVVVVDSVKYKQPEQLLEKNSIVKEFIAQPYIVEDDEIILQRCEYLKKEQCPTDIVVPTRVIPSWYHALWTNPP